MNKSFCSLPWLNLTTNTLGEIIPCCISTQVIKKEDGTPFNLGTDSIDEIYNSSAYIKIREQMLSGELVSGCEECYKHENNGGRSNRNFNNQQWLVENPEPIAEPKIKYFDIRFGNLCNLACRSCNPGNSSQLAKESNALQEIGMSKFHSLFLQDTNTWYNNDQFSHNLESQLENIEHVYLAGGEPSVNKKVFEVLERFIATGRNKHITISTSTNMTNSNPKFFELVQQFKQVVLFASIDGYGTIQEYLRYPSKWSAVHTNMQYMASLDNILLYVTPVIQIGNLNNITDLFEYVESFNRDKGKTLVDIVPIDLESPDHLNLLYLPSNYKKTAWDRIDHWFNQNNQYIGDVAIDRLNAIKTKCLAEVSSDELKKHLTTYIEYNNIFDSSRKLKLAECNPELAEILNDPSLWY